MVIHEKEIVRGISDCCITAQPRKFTFNEGMLKDEDFLAVWQRGTGGGNSG